MKEVTFINRNKKRWEAFEQELKKPTAVDPDVLADQFIQLMDDLAFARTFYPRTPIFQYLNTLSQQAHQVVYRNKRESSRRIKTFIKTELPLELRAARPWFLLSLAVFLFAWLLGCASVLNDEGFIRLILGNDYVNMTLDNIEQGDPMAVYKSMDQLPMFVFITFNNVYVAFRVFLYGILTPLGSVWQLFLNGLMVGSFQTFFIEKNLFGVSTMAVMIHGTLELSAIIIAGGAGIMLSKNLFFPGTYSRKEAFINGASKGLKIMLGVIPVFMVAGFFEGFVTRHYATINTWLNSLIIMVSLAFIIWYFFIYPEMVYRRSKREKQA